MLRAGRDVLLSPCAGGGRRILASGTRPGLPLEVVPHPALLVQAADGAWALGPLLRGLLVTFQIAALALVLALVFGLGRRCCACRALHRPAGGARLRGNVRNTPLLTQIFFLYYVAAPVLGLDAFASACWPWRCSRALTPPKSSAGHPVRGPGQWEAALSTGLTRWQTYRRVILPPAVRRVLPPLTGVAVSLVKDSSLASTIAIFELTQQGNIIASDTFLVFETWFTVAAIYLCVTLPLSLAAAGLERRLGTGC
jgi:polar amino acid transport system permease protein